MKLKFHRHKWQEINREMVNPKQMEVPTPMQGALGPTFQTDKFTVVTYKCAKCPEHWQVRLFGHIGASMLTSDDSIRKLLED